MNICCCCCWAPGVLNADSICSLLMVLLGTGGGFSVGILLLIDNELKSSERLFVAATGVAGLLIILLELCRLGILGADFLFTGFGGETLLFLLVLKEVSNARSKLGEKGFFSSKFSGFLGSYAESKLAEKGLSSSTEFLVSKAESKFGENDSESLGLSPKAAKFSKVGENCFSSFNFSESLSFCGSSSKSSSKKLTY